MWGFENFKKLHEKIFVGLARRDQVLVPEPGGDHGLPPPLPRQPVREPHLHPPQDCHNI